jgi:DNA polymerase III psi subunit
MEIVKGMYFLRELLRDDVFVVNENKRYPLLTLIENPSADYLSPQEEEFLEKILKAVHIKIEEIKVINVASPKPENYFESLQELPAKRVINFGTSFEKINLPLHFDKYMPVAQQGITFLMADSLDTISQDLEKKKQLWKALQQIFLN